MNFCIEKRLFFTKHKVFCGQVYRLPGHLFNFVAVFQRAFTTDHWRWGVEIGSFGWNIDIHIYDDRYTPETEKAFKNYEKNL